MATTVGKEGDLGSLVEDLIKLDFAAIDAYDAAITRLSSSEFKRQLAEFRDDHTEHTRVLGAWMRQQGDTPPEGAGPKQLLSTGKVVLAGLAGDKQILEAMKTNEEDTNTAYERAVNHREAGPVRGICERNLADERRHRAWMEATIARL